jgi:ribonuclease HI
MRVARPHYLLFSEAFQTVAEHSANHDATGESGGRWHFVIEAVDGSRRYEAADLEDAMDRERLELLAVVRGLEALDEPAEVTLVTASPYVSRGFRFGLAEWRESNWQWERFGEMIPVKNHDLWRRVDQAMKFHRVKCRIWRFDAAHMEPAAASQASSVAAPAMAETPPRRERRRRSAPARQPHTGWAAASVGWLARLRGAARRCRPPDLEACRMSGCLCFVQEGERMPTASLPLPSWPVKRQNFAYQPLSTTGHSPSPCLGRLALSH